MLTWLTEEIDPRPLGMARIAVGIAAVIRVFVAVPVLFRLTQDDIIRLPYAEWIPSPTITMVSAILILWFVSAVLFTLGWRTAIAGPVLSASIAAVLLLDLQTYSNHLYLMLVLTLLLTLAQAGSGLNLGNERKQVVRWPVMLIMMQLSIVYGFSGLSKINDGFLSGRVLAGDLRNGIVSFPESLLTPRILSALAVLVIAVEIAIALLIWLGRYRPLIFALGLALHTSIPLLMSATGELTVFSIQMLGLYPLFLRNDRLRVIWSQECRRCRRFIRWTRRFDVLEVVDDVPSSSNRDMTLTHFERTTTGAGCRVRILEHLVPWLWIAPILRLPGLRQIGSHQHTFGEANQ